MWWISGTFGHFILLLWFPFGAFFRKRGETVKSRWQNEPVDLRLKQGYLVVLYYVIVWGVWVATILLNEAWFC